jgi:hypothetical protein
MYTDRTSRSETADFVIQPPAAVEMEEATEHVHYPAVSIWPITMALGVTLGFAGFVSSWYISGIGVAIAFIALVAWIQELRHEHEHQQH